ncbi:retrovirus-related pol polyprotein from transposon TNT 1-94, partial [Tanacetum coccineum]
MEENIMKSHIEGPFHMGTVSDVITGGTEGAVQQGPVRARVLNDLSAEEKESSELTKDDRESQLYDEFEHFCQNKGETIQGYYVSYTADLSNNEYPTQSSKSPQPSKEPSPADHFQLDSGSSSTENLIESLSNTFASSLNSQNHFFLKLTINLELRSNARTKLWFKTEVVQDVRGRYNATNQGRPFQRNNARGNGIGGNVGAQNRGGMINPGQAKPINCYNYNGLGHIARECPRPKRLQDSDYFKDK